MKPIKLFEKKLYTFVGSADQDNQPAVKEFLSFWKHFDKLYYTNHFDTILALSSEDAKRFTKEGLAMHLHICSRTLSRYRQLYLRSYQSFCEDNIPE